MVERGMRERCEGRGGKEKEGQHALAEEKEKVLTSLSERS
jgi:hypothetical protein